MVSNLIFVIVRTTIYAERKLRSKTVAVLVCILLITILQASAIIVVQIFLKVLNM
jgi:hypothetical protein